MLDDLLLYVVKKTISPLNYDFTVFNDSSERVPSSSSSGRGETQFKSLSLSLKIFSFLTCNIQKMFLRFL